MVNCGLRYQGLSNSWATIAANRVLQAGRNPRTSTDPHHITHTKRWTRGKGMALGRHSSLQLFNMDKIDKFR